MEILLFLTCEWLKHVSEFWLLRPHKNFFSLKQNMKGKWHFSFFRTLVFGGVCQGVSTPGIAVPTLWPYEGLAWGEAEQPLLLYRDSFLYTLRQISPSKQIRGVARGFEIKHHVHTPMTRVLRQGVSTHPCWHWRWWKCPDTQHLTFASPFSQSILGTILLLHCASQIFSKHIHIQDARSITLKDAYSPPPKISFCCYCHSSYFSIL